MQGRRVYPDEQGQIFLAPGDYVKDPKTGEWIARPPKENVFGGGLRKHEVIEHEDGTITVSPSILVNAPGQYHDPSSGTWHGFLERGIWREC